MAAIALDKVYNDFIALIQLSRDGLNYATFEKVMNRSSFSIKEWSDYLHISERTLQRYKKEKKAFEPIQSERILEIAKLLNRGKEIFGTTEQFEVWLHSNLVSLGGACPKNLLDSSFGIDLVNDELTRIEYGVLA